MITKLDLPDEYAAYIEQFARELKNTGVITIDGQAAVIIAALNLLDEFLQKIGVDTEEERSLRLQVLADLSRAKELLSEE